MPMSTSAFEPVPENHAIDFAPANSFTRGSDEISSLCKHSRISIRLWPLSRASFFASHPERGQRLRGKATVSNPDAPPAEHRRRQRISSATRGSIPTKRSRGYRSTISFRRSSDREIGACEALESIRVNVTIGYTSP